MSSDTGSGGLRADFELWGAWRSLELDAAGQLLEAHDADGSDEFDLVRRRRRRNDEAWVPFSE